MGKGNMIFLNQTHTREWIPSIFFPFSDYPQPNGPIVYSLTCIIECWYKINKFNRILDRSNFIGCIIKFECISSNSPLNSKTVCISNDQIL